VRPEPTKDGVSDIPTETPRPVAEDDELTLLACQIDIPHMTTAAERDRHLAMVARKVATQLEDTPVDIVVLPELSSIEYSRRAFDCLDALAEPLDGASFDCWRVVAMRHKVFVSYSFARRAQDGFRISIGVVNPQGMLVGYFDKLHLAQYGASMEKEYFKRGDDLFAFDVKGFRLAPFICYDIRFPELARALVLDHGVDVILHCGAYFRDPSFHTWHAFAITRAVENQVFLLSLNRAGPDFGGSLFCYPWMDETLGPLHFDDHREDFRRITINRNSLTAARTDYTFLHDRRSTYTLPAEGGPK
jgi:nitrilase